MVQDSIRRVRALPAGKVTASQRPDAIADFYVGAYGPSIFVWATRAGIAHLASVFRRQAGQQTSSQMAEANVIELRRGLRIELITDYTEGKHLALIGAGPTFAWTGSPSQWVDLAAMLEILLNPTDPLITTLGAHQYLTDDEDDALVEVSYNEIPPAQLPR